MIRQKELFHRSIFLTADVVVSVVAFLGALALRAFVPEHLTLPLVGTLPRLPSFSSFAVLIPAIVLLWTYSLYAFETHDFRVPLRTLAARYAKAVVLGGAGLVFFAFAAKLIFLPRSLIAVFLAIDWLLLMVGRIAILRVTSMVLRRQAAGHHVVIVGTRESIGESVAAIRRTQSMRFTLVGCLIEGFDPTRDADIAGARVLGAANQIGEILTREIVDVVFFAAGALEAPVLEEAIALCDERGVHAAIGLFKLRNVSAHMNLGRIDGVPTLTLARTPTNEVALLVKRVTDILVSATALLALAPLLGAVALAIKLDSPGPILYSQTRLGRMGRPFRLLKFRSMCDDAEKARSVLADRNEASGPMFKIKRDPRVTRVGRVIRKLSADELPQLINVLRGEMSLVGPRPSLPQEIAQFEPWQRRRLSMKPGITCIWQVSGRNQVGFSEWMKMDLQYIDTWSLQLDLRILAKTVPVVLFGAGAS